jgi:hypothetical protein
LAKNNPPDIVLDVEQEFVKAPGCRNHRADAPKNSDEPTGRAYITQYLNLALSVTFGHRLIGPEAIMAKRFHLS